jgi:transitional endoplasmic reticulum ATPase
MERGLAKARAEDWPAASEAFRKAVSLDPENNDARFRLGWALWNRSERARPTTGDLVLGYGAQVLGFDSLAAGKGQKFAAHRKLLQEAVHWLRDTLSRDPSHSRAHFFLAQALKVLGYQDEALLHAQKATELEPGNSQFATLALNIVEPTGSTLGGASTPAKTGPRLTWDDLILPAKTKRELRQMQLVIENPAAAKELGVDPPTGILLKGPPGTGKTTIARVLASEAKVKFYTITPADVNNMFVGQSEKRVKDLFERARETAPSIIFIDEIDALLPARAGGMAVHSDKVVNQFLQEMDGMTPNGRVFVVGATNRADMLDPALLRGGRLSREIEIPLPERDARRSLIGLFTKTVKLSEDVDLDKLAEDTEGRSGADLKALVNEAGLQALIRIADSADEGTERVLTPADFGEALRALDDE